MKYILSISSIVPCFLFCLLLLLSACSSTTPSNQKAFGEKIDEQGAITMAKLVNKMDGKAEMATKVEGEVEAVCQKKGCWMTLKRPDGESMRVRFKDYGFFVPMDISGKTVVVEGLASMDTTTVADLRHYAQDEGLTAEDIAKITEPEIEMVFLADGVIIK